MRLCVLPFEPFGGIQNRKQACHAAPKFLMQHLSADHTHSALEETFLEQEGQADHDVRKYARLRPMHPSITPVFQYNCLLALLTPRSPLSHRPLWHPFAHVSYPEPTFAWRTWDGFKQHIVYYLHVRTAGVTRQCFVLDLRLLTTQLFRVQR